MNTDRASAAPATLGGLLAVIIWSTTVAVSRSSAEALGAVTAAALLLGGGGVLGLAVQGVRYRGFGFIRTIPRRYLVVCGILFVVYEASLYLAIGMAAGRGQVLAVGVINYLWIPLTQVFSVLVLRNRASAWLIPGILLATGGAVLAVIAGAGGGFSLPGTGAAAVYCLSAFCAVTWALYSNYSRLLGGTGNVSAVPLFLAASGALLALFLPFINEHSVWNARAGVELLYLTVFPSMLGYLLWDGAMRRGNMTLVTACAYSIPVASTVIAGRYLNVHMGILMWTACGMVTAGAFITRYAIKEHTA